MRSRSGSSGTRSRGGDFPDKAMPTPVTPAAARPVALASATQTAQLAGIAVDTSHAAVITMGVSLVGMVIIMCWMCMKMLKDVALEQERMREAREQRRDTLRLQEQLNERARFLAPGVQVPRTGPLASLWSNGKLSGPTRGPPDGAASLLRSDSALGSCCAYTPLNPNDHGFQPTPLTPFAIDLEELQSLQSATDERP